MERGLEDWMKDLERLTAARHQEETTWSIEKVGYGSAVSFKYRVVVAGEEFPFQDTFLDAIISACGEIVGRARRVLAADSPPSASSR